MDIYVASDNHFGHASIQEYEPARQIWADVPAMNVAMIDWWNSTVRPEDFVFYLGDFAMGKIADSLPYAKRLNGRKWLINGNHDRTMTHKPSQVRRWRAAYHAVGFEVICDELEFTFEGTPIRMCHFPYEGDHTEEGERYSWRRPVDDGTVLVHGHLHSMQYATLSKAGTPQVNVGIDAICKSCDVNSYLQRYTPRRSRSIWSKINVDNVQRLIADGRMTGHGIQQVDAAKADGRWDRAYGAGKDMKIAAYS